MLSAVEVGFGLEHKAWLAMYSQALNCGQF